MAGQGKYTTYAPVASDKNTLLNKLFKSSDPVVQYPFQDLVGKETDAISVAVSQGKALLQPVLQQGDPGHFPNGVYLDYSALNAPVQAPDTTEGVDVKWTNAGDPANSYVPDITSPGPGKTSGLDKSTDPKIAVADLKPNYVPGGPDTGTKSPVNIGAKVHSNNLLGTVSKMGDSGANS